MKKISIIDFGSGNLLSLQRAFRQLSEEAVIINSPADVKKANLIVLPGDGAFKAGMQEIKKRQLTRAIKNHWRQGKPILGICLGMQLLFTKGYEFGACDGLDILKGKVVSFGKFKEENVSVPHIGWNSIKLKNGKEFTVYFVHSYICQPDGSEMIYAETNYGGITFPAMVKQGNVFGCQFHPEKSGEDGLRIIELISDLFKNNI